MVPTDDGTQADLVVTEPNGDQHSFRCLCRPDGRTEIEGDQEALDYLTQRYGEQTLWRLARTTTLAELL